MHCKIPSCVPGSEKVGKLAVGADIGARRNVDGEVILIYISELLIHYVVYRVTQPECGQKQRRATRDAENGHEETFLVSDYIARRNLCRKSEMAPDDGDTFEEYPLPGFRCTLTHEGCGAFAQLGYAGCKCCGGGADYCYRCYDGKVIPPERRECRGHIIEHRVRTGYDLG